MKLRTNKIIFLTTLFVTLSPLVSTTTAQTGLGLDLSTTTSNSRSAPEASTVLGLFILSFFAIVQRFKTNTISLSKTQRDLHEGKKFTSKIEEARVEKILTEHDLLK